MASAYLALMYALWARERTDNLAHLRALAHLPTMPDWLPPEHVALLADDLQAIEARFAARPEAPDRYDRLLLDLDAMFARYYRRALNRFD